MNGRKLTDQELEIFAAAVVKAGCNSRDVEGLISDPKLYHGVLAKVARESEAGRQPSRPLWRPIAALAAAVILVSVSFAIYFGSAPEAPRVQRSVVPDTIDEIRPRSQVSASVVPPQSADEPEPVRAAMKRGGERPQAARALPAKRPPLKDAEPVFHPLGFAERAVDAAIDGRVVRVEMPRSALFALGVDLPLENGTRSVKADLLVGADGSPRAIRLVE